MSARKLRLLAECIERNFITEEDRRGWVSDLRGLAKNIERQQCESAGEKR
jgi:hypothetical protein